MRDGLRDQAYWQETPIPHPSHIDFQPVHMGVMTEVVQRVKGILNDYPTISVSTTSTSTLQVKRTTEMEDFANHLFPALEDDADADVWDPVLEDVIRFGRGYDELLYVPHYRSDQAPDYPSRSQEENDKAYSLRFKSWQLHARLPIVWRHLPARNVFTWRDELGISEALIVEERAVRDLLRRYDLPGLASQVSADQTLLFQRVYFGRYWNRAYGAYWAGSQAVPRGQSEDESFKNGLELLRMTQGDLTDIGQMSRFYNGVDFARMAKGEMAAVYENMYGYVPIIETSGLTSSTRRAGRKQLSVFDHMMGVCLYLDTLISQKASAVRVWAWPTPFLKNLGINGQVIAQTALAEDGRPIPIEIEPGKMLTLLPGEDIGWLVVPENGAGADSLISIIQGQADLLGLTSAVFSGEALGSNGYLYNSVLNAIRSKYSPLVKHIKRSHRQRVQMAFRIVELHGEPLNVFKPGDGKEAVGEWVGFNPDHARGLYYNIEVHFEDHLPTDDAANMSMARQASEGDNPLMDQNMARTRYLQDDSPERTEERVLVQKYLRSPQVEQFNIAKAVERAGAMLDQQERGNPEAAQNMSPEQRAKLPPALLEALGAGGAGMNPDVAGVMSGNPLAAGAAPSAEGGIAGAPAAPYIPGVNRPLTPPPPRPAGGGRPGRAVGQSRAPAEQPPGSTP